ncbi:MAG TPA: YqhA family protein [Ktedonobacterales bacterium]|nr:YqhA family protein [Ktedonobacterales bacterium]
MQRIGHVLAKGSYLVLLGIIASLALSVVLFLVSIGRSALVIEEALAAVTSAKAAKLLVVDCVEMVDLILLAVALYITGLGLFELFIAPTPMPAWLLITSLDDLKSRLINIVVVALAVTFFGQVVTWDGQTNLLALGVGIGAVVLALSVFSALHFGSSHAPASPRASETV